MNCSSKPRKHPEVRRESPNDPAKNHTNCFSIFPFLFICCNGCCSGGVGNEPRSLCLSLRLYYLPARKNVKSLSNRWETIRSFLASVSARRRCSRFALGLHHVAYHIALSTQHRVTMCVPIWTARCLEQV